jgi:ParB family chromosome partitioning protein
MVLPEDQPGAAEAGIIEQIDVVSLADGGEKETGEAAPAGARFSDALRQDLRVIRRGARQTAALAEPDLLLALLAFHLSSPLAQGFSLRGFAVEVKPTTETGYAPDPRLLDTEAGRSGAGDVARAFKALRKKGSAHIREVLTLELARLLDLPDHGDGALAAHFDQSTKVNVRAVWTPTAENFFKRVPGAYLDALWCEMTGTDPESAEARAFAKAKKGEKAARLETLFDPATELAPEQRARVAAWLPPEMA